MFIPKIISTRFLAVVGIQTLFTLC